MMAENYYKWLSKGFIEEYFEEYEWINEWLQKIVFKKLIFSQNNKKLRFQVCKGLNETADDGNSTLEITDQVP